MVRLLEFADHGVEFVAGHMRQAAPAFRRRDQFGEHTCPEFGRRDVAGPPFPVRRGESSPEFAQFLLGRKVGGGALRGLAAPDAMPADAGDLTFGHGQVTAPLRGAFAFRNGFRWLTPPAKFRAALRAWGW